MAKKGGVHLTEEMEKVLNSENLSEIPAAFADQISKTTWGFTEAINNPDIRNKVFAERFDSWDANFSKMFERLELIPSADEYKTLRGDTAFPEWLKKMPETVADLVKEKGNPDSSKVKQELQTRLQEVTQELEDLRNAQAAEINALKINFVMQQKLSGYTLNDTAKGMAQTVYRDIQDKIGAKAVMKLNAEGGIDLFNKEDPELRLTGEKNEVINLDTYLDSLMAPFVKKSDGGGGGTGDGNSRKTIENKDTPRRNPMVYGPAGG
jgi:alanyl-tRNA synthetase